MKNQHSASPFDASPVDFRRFFSKYLAHWRWFAASAVVFGLLCIYYLLSATPIYEVRSTVLIKEVVPRGDSRYTETPASQSDMAELFAPKRIIENEMQILTSRSLLRRVVDSLDLNVVYVQKGLFRDTELYAGALPYAVELLKPGPGTWSTTLEISLDRTEGLRVNGRSVAPGSELTGDYGTIRVSVNDSLRTLYPAPPTAEVSFLRENAAVDQLLYALAVAPLEKGSTVLELTLESAVPAKGERVLNELVCAYGQLSVEEKNSVTRLGIDFIDERLKALAVEIDTTELWVEQFKTAQGITNLDAESQSILQSVMYNDQAVNRARNQLDVLKTLRQQVEAGNYPAENMTAALGISDYSLNSQIVELTRIESERAKALYTIKPDNYIIKAYDEQIADLRARVIKSIELVWDGIEVSYTTALSEQKRLDALQHSIPTKERKLMEITRRLDNQNHTYVTLQAKKEELELVLASTVADSRAVDSAHATPFPIRPVRTNVVLVFLILAVLVPVCAILLIDLFDNKVQSKEDVEKSTAYPIVGEIPLLRSGGKYLNMSRDHSVEAEQFRTLRTNIGFMQTTVREGARLIMITSSVSGEGKSFVAANLASSFAALGKRTLVLGFDLRKPGVSKIFGKNFDMGLSNYLTGQATLEQIIERADDIENLDMIACGYLAPNPQELLEGERLPELFRQITARYDYIVIDTAPIGLFSDAALLAPYADVTLCVVRQGFTPKEMVKEINDRGRFSNVGIVMNRISKEHRYGYYAGGRKYYNSYYGKDK